MSSNAPVAIIPAGDHLVDEANIREVFTTALAQGGYVILRPWQDFSRKENGELVLEWQWLLTVGGSFHGYSPAEFMLDLAVPMRPGSDAIRDATTLEVRGRIARELGLGVPPPEAAVVTEEPETKVLQLPTPPLPPPDPYAPDDPNLFPG